MIKDVDLSPEAELEVLEAYGWYEDQRVGLGEEFLTCVDAVVSRIQRTPEIYPIVHRRIRRALTRRFPYCVFYVIDPNAIVILAVFHSNRDLSDVYARSH